MSLVNEEIIRRTAKMLAGESIEVLMEGFAPRVEYDTHLQKPVRIVLPSIPEDASKDMLAGMQGYLDHEVGHILFSDTKDICNTTQSRMWHYIHNCIDDPRVNRSMADAYPGCFPNIKAAYDYIYKVRSTTTSLKDRVNSVDLADIKALKDAQAEWCFLWFARKMNCAFTSDFYQEANLDRIYRPLEKMLDPEKVRSLGKLRTSSDIKYATDYFTDFFDKEFKDQQGGGGSNAGDGDPSQAKQADGQTGESDGKFKSFEDHFKQNVDIDIKQSYTKTGKGFYYSDKHVTVVDKNKMLRAAQGQNFMKFENDVRSVSNYIMKDLMRLLEERRRVYYVGGYKSGKLNTKSLYSARLGNDRIFKKKNEVRNTNAAVSLLIDMSGSMSGQKVEVAMQSAYAFALVLDRLNIPFEIRGFTTGHAGMDSDLLARFENDMKGNPQLRSQVISLGCQDYMYIPKSFNDNFDTGVKKILAHAGQRGYSMQSNEDARHVLTALKSLQRRPEAKKALFVFSDGQPAYGDWLHNRQAVYENLKRMGHDALAEYGVQVYGIGIKSTNVEYYYKKYKVVHDVNELPKALFGFLKEAI